MNWVPLVSSNLNAYLYDPDSKVLQIRFNSGRVHGYRDVTQDVVDGLDTASSPGKYFNENIKNNYSPA